MKSDNKIWDIIKILLITLCIVFVFGVACWIWFKGLGHPVQEKQIIISLETYSNNIDSTSAKEIDSKLKNNQKQIEELKNLISELKGYQTKLNDLNSQFTKKEYLTISTLNGFYAALFTAIAVLVGIAGLFAWKTISNLKEIENKVNILHEKKDCVEWVKQKIPDNESYIGLSKLSLSSKEKRKLKEIRTLIINEFTENSWLEIILAKDFLDDKEYEKAFKIYNFIELRDLLDGNSKIEPVLYHMIGQLYSEYYFEKIYGDTSEKDKGDTAEKENEFDKLGHDDEKISYIKHLEKTEKYYRKSLSIREKQKMHKDETLGSLAIILIELYIEEGEKDKKKLEDAEKLLKEVISLNKATYNTYLDLARAKYLKDDGKNKKENEAKKYLLIAVEKINTTKQKDNFLRLIERDKQLKKMGKISWAAIKNEIIKKIDQKQWLK